MTLRRVAASTIVRVVFTALAVALVAFLVIPQASAQIAPEPDPDTGLCPDGRRPDETGNCATPAVECEDGTFPKEGEECGPDTTTTTTTTQPCPDGADFCEQIASCPVNNPLPPGSRCDVVVASAPTTTAPAPTPPAPAPTGDGADVRGRVVEQPATAAPPPPAPTAPAAPAAPAVSGEDLARTGPADGWLGAVGAVLVLAGWLLVRLSRPAGFVSQ